MKRLSIRTTITLWFSVALILVVSITYFMVLFVGDQIIQKTIRDNLIETVEHNVDEIEFYKSVDDAALAGSLDHYVKWDGGFLEVDDDFLDEINQVYTSLCKADGSLVYGENPVAKETASVTFRNATIQQIKVGGTTYYIFDRKLTQDGLEGLWLRGVVSEVQGAIQLNSIARTSLILLPFIVLVAIVGGYLITKRTLKPIQKLSDAAAQIGQGSDLNKRIEIGEGKDELHQLAEQFNQMFGRLDNAFQAERQFTSDASHELRTPMSVILAQCELSLEHEQSPQEYKDALTIVQRQGQKMAKLINDMLDFTRLELKPDRYSKEQLDLTKLVSSVCEDMALIRENNIALTCAAQENITLCGNAELFTRLLTNLISNAYHYGKENGHIFVSLKAEENKILLSVQDDGIGIAEKDRENIFRRFYQADNSRTGTGTGLGLAMVQEIVKFHGGEILVESEIGIGSKFICIFEKN